jgi:hypothetical protein
MDICIINNLGKTCSIFIGLSDNQKFESLLWLLEKFSSLFRQKPKVIFTDDDETLRKGKDLLFY